MSASFGMSVCLPDCLSVCMLHIANFGYKICLSALVCLPDCLTACLCVCFILQILDIKYVCQLWYVCLPVCLSVCMLHIENFGYKICLSALVCLSVCLSVCMHNNTGKILGQNTIEQFNSHNQKLLL